MFRKAFGILDRSEITKELAAKAIAQFERSLVSSGTSRFDRKFLAAEPFVDFSDSEFRGFDMYFDIPGSPMPDAQCFHCHDAPLFTHNEFFNNGLQEVATLNDFADRGRGAVTGRVIDNGKFRAPSLRNIMLSAPYMHNGSLLTIEDVLEQIVGDIEDEHDVEEDGYIKPLPSGDYLIKALTPIDSFNETFDSQFSDNEYDTVGGLVMNAFGHLPKRNEVTEIGEFRFRVLNADSRRIHLLRLTPISR
jgi:hypothetical protein